MNRNHTNQITSTAGFTLVELLVVVSIIGLLVAILLPSLSKARDQAITVKCLANCHSQGLAIQTYAADYQGTLPGPIHPAIKRKLFSLGPLAGGGGGGGRGIEQDRLKSLTWLLRPYYGTSGDATQENTFADRISSCPKAEVIVPDEAFLAYQTGSCWDERPYSYVCNSWGPTGIDAGTTPGPTGSIEWTHTDPPHYFGAWFYCDASPDVPPHNRRVSWKPKTLEQIRFASAEWAVADAWYRRISAGAARPGSMQQRQWLGTFAPQVANYKPLIPDRPYHGIRSSEVSSHNQAGLDVLPKIGFNGVTNMGYFDAHGDSHKGQWTKKGEGGTVNPFWTTFGGTHDPTTWVWQP